MRTLASDATADHLLDYLASGRAEDVYAAVAVGLRKAGLDADSTPETSRLGEPDESQLNWAAGQAALADKEASFLEAGPIARLSKNHRIRHHVRP